MPRRARRLVILLLIVVLTGGLLSALVLARSVRQAADAGGLSPADWLRLRSDLARNLSARRGRTARAGPAASPADPGRPVPSVEPQRRPSRPARPGLDEATLARQAEEYAAQRRKTVIELQKYRKTWTIDAIGPDGIRGSASLHNLNPAINSWYVLLARWEDGSETRLHLANGRPELQDLELDPSHPTGVMIVQDGSMAPCDLFSNDASEKIAAAVRSRTPYLQLCDEAVTVRLKTTGHRTAKEWTTDFLRDNVWGGERLTVFVRRTLFQDAYISTSELVPAEVSPGAGSPVGGPGPPPGRIDGRHASTLLDPVDLGIALEGTAGGRLVPGRWYPVRGASGMFLSATQAGLLDQEILRSHTSLAAVLDEVETKALVYLIAFDLSRYGLGFSIGTDHPRVGWSERVADDVRDPALPGPDGIGDIAPLVATGIIPAAVAERTVATFTGGFKRGHGAFRTGPLSRASLGSHYGFIESGVVLSKLQPGLATIFVLDDGTVELKTWAGADDPFVERIRFARQNGLPVVEIDSATGLPKPGDMVARWALGNWSGSQDKKFRTLRAGACLTDGPEGRFLIYGYFSSATPSAMARVFQAYGCGYGMLLDMNALEHTYLALYDVRDGQFRVQHLITGMNVLDKTVGGLVVPRFLGFADNRDFFYMTLKSDRAEATLQTPLNTERP